MQEKREEKKERGKIWYKGSKRPEHEKPWREREKAKRSDKSRKGAIRRKWECKSNNMYTMKIICFI